MVILQNIWWYLVLIGVMILIHELGHFGAARLFDVRVETFSFGFGPRLFGFRRGDTDYRFSAILFGGYVKMGGELPGEEAANADDPRALLSKPRWQRLIIAFAGPFVNIVLAVVILTGLFMVRFPKEPSVASPVVGYVVPDGAAAKAGIQEGDKIVQIDNVNEPTWDDIAMKEIANAGQPLTVWAVRNGERLRFILTPILDQKQGVGFAGWTEQSEIEIDAIQADMGAAKAGLQKGDILLSANGQPIRSIRKLHDIDATSGGKPVNIVYSRNGKQGEAQVIPTKTKTDGVEDWMIGVQLGPRMVFVGLPLPKAFAESVRTNAKSATLSYQLLRGMIERRMSAKSLLGPVRIAQVSGDAAREGLTAFLGLMSMLSLQLAIFNLLPIPILDGGVIMLLVMEMFMRRDLSLRVKEAVFKVGFVFLMAVVAFVIYNDISSLAG
jgi:regulator of sigma E protease